MKRRMTVMGLFVLLLLLLASCHKHEYREQIFPPTCTEDGYVEYSCLECGHVKRTAGDTATGHDQEETLRDAPCNEHTVTVLTCRICGEVSEQEREEMGSLHDYETTVRYPDRENGGYTLYQCRNCDTSYTDRYTDPVDFSVGLAYTIVGGEYYVSGMGSCRDTHVIIPAISEQGYPVKGILSRGLNSLQVKSVTVRDGVHDIQSGAFYGCINLTSLILPALATPQENALGFLPKLESLTMPLFHPLAYYFEDNGDYNSGYRVYQKDGSGTCIGMVPYTLTHVNVLLRMVPFSFAQCKYLTDVTLDSRITEIPQGAFTECYNLENIRFSESLVSISENAFRDCDSLKEVSFPDTLKHLGSYAFAASGLERALLPASLILSSQDVGIFRECTSLTEVRLAGESTVLPPSTFEKCKQLAKVSLPNSITVIEPNAFAECGELFSLTLPSSLCEIKNTAFYKTSLMEVNFPNSLSVLGAQVFAYCKRLTSIDLENTALTKIPEGAFAGCMQLSSIKLPRELTYIGNYAFDGVDLSKSPLCLPPTLTYVGGYSLQGAVIEEFCPSGIVEIGSAAFSGSTIKRLVLPEGMTVIESNAFAFCTELEEIVFPSTLRTINYNAFEGCTSLKRIELPNGLYSIAQCAFMDCTSLEEVILPSSLQEIAYQAFKNCTSLLEITLPKSLHTLRDCAFMDCTSLKRAEFLRDVVTLGPSLFAGATSLETLILPAKQTQIPAYLCKDATSLKRITIPSTVTSISHHAFVNCVALETVDFSGAKSTLQNSCFEGCSALTEVKNGSSLLDFTKDNFVGTPLLIEENGLTIVMGRLVAVEKSSDRATVILPDSVVYVNNYVFSYWEGLEEVVFPAGLTHIGTGALSNCSKLSIVTFPDSLEELPDALLDGSDIMEIHLGSGLKRVAATALPAYGNQFVVYYNGTEAQWRNVQGHDGKALSKRRIYCLDTTLEGILYTGTFSNVTVELTTDGVLTFGGSGSAVISGGTHYFEPQGNITKIVFKEGVESVTYTTYTTGLFSKMVNVTEVELSSTIKYLYPKDFQGTQWYETFHADPDNLLILNDRLLMVSQSRSGSFSIPENITEIADYALWECRLLTEILLPQGLVSIGREAFYACEKVTEITIPTSVKTMGDSAFYYCHSLTELTVPQGIRIKGRLATSCDRLRRVELQKGVVAEQGVASNCPALEVVILAEGCTELPINTLYECDSLQYVFLPAGITKIDSSAFWNTPHSTSFLCQSTEVYNLLKGGVPGLAYVYSETQPTDLPFWWCYAEDGSVELHH